jgi:hypothetical protein
MKFLSLEVFNELLKDEKVLFVINRHKAVFLFKVFKTLFTLTFVLILIGLSFKYKNILQKLLDDSTYFYGEIIFIFMFIGFFIYRFLFLYIDWKYDKLMITNQRIVYVDQHFIFGSDITSILIKDIVNIRSFHKGITSSILKFGTIIIETSGLEECMIHFMPNHQKVTQIIQNIKEDPLFYKKHKDQFNETSKSAVIKKYLNTRNIINTILKS